MSIEPVLMLGAFTAGAALAAATVLVLGHKGRRVISRPLPPVIGALTILPPADPAPERQADPSPSDVVLGMLRQNLGRVYDEPEQALPHKIEQRLGKLDTTVKARRGNVDARLLGRFAPKGS